LDSIIDQLPRGVYLELSQNLRTVGRNCFIAHGEQSGYFLDRLPGCDESENFIFSVRKEVHRLTGRSEKDVYGLTNQAKKYVDAL
jgi:hypothetical protein